MNKTKIEWCDYTWNPVTGCKNGCPYCYARDLAEGWLSHTYPNGFAPTFWPKRLRAPLKRKKPSRIFVSSMGEFLGPWVPRQWQNMVLSTVKACPWHTFIFLTKFVEEAQYIDWPDNAWVGCSVDMLKRKDPALVVEILAAVNAPVTFISFEPLTGPLDPRTDFWPMGWAIIGAATGKKAEQYPTEANWIEDVLIRADKYEVPVFMKDNLKPYWKGEFRREFPDA